MLPPHVVDPAQVRTPLDALGLVLYALLFIAVAVATKRRPVAGIVALIAVVPFAFYRYVGDTTITFSKVALLAAVAGLAWRRASPLPLGSPASRRIALAAVAVIAATALSIVHAEFRTPVLRETLKACEYLALFATVIVAARADLAREPVRWVVAASLALVSVLALAQEIAGAPSGLWFAFHAIPRIAGPLEGPNQLAGYLGIALPVVVAFRASADARGGTRMRSLENFALFAGAAALVLTISRAGVFAAMLACAIALVRSARGGVREMVPAFAGAFAGVAVLAFWGFAATHSLGGLDLLGRFSTLAEVPQPGSVGNRSQLWHAALVLWHRHPLFGIGAGNFEFELARAGYPGIRTHANSLYLQSLAEGGAISFAATLALVAVSILTFARGRPPLVVAAFAASVGFALHQVFDLLVFFPKVGELWWIVLALGAASVDGERRTNA